MAIHFSPRRWCATWRNAASLTAELGEYVRGAEADDTACACNTAGDDRRTDRPPRRGAKRTLNAAAVIGARFAEDQLASLVDRVCVAELLEAELIDEAASTPTAEYILPAPARPVGGLRISVAVRPRGAAPAPRVGTAAARNPASLDENAALIAMHVEAAGDLRAAFDWHMRAGTWLTPRDIVGGASELATCAAGGRTVAREDPDRVRMRVQPARYCADSAWRAGLSSAETGFEELRRLCAEIGDERSVAIGMSGMVMALAFRNRPREASELGAELSALIERIDDSELTTAVLFAARRQNGRPAKYSSCRGLRERVIDAAGRRSRLRGNLFFGSPLSLATAHAGVAHMCLGRAGWKADLDDAIAVARRRSTR